MEKNRVAIVTGAGHGIGKAIAAKFVENGIYVVIADKNKRTGSQSAKELSVFGQVKFIPTDVSSEASVKSLIKRTIKEFGRIDILINDAGILNIFKPIEKLTLKDWLKVIGTNLTGYFLTAKYATPFLKKVKGTVVNIASTRAFMSELGSEAYAASKGGVVAFTHALAQSLAPDVRVNCISPDWIDTGHEKVTEENEKSFPVGRVGDPKDVASLAFFLVNPENSFINATNQILDGGITRKMHSYANPN